MVRSGQAGLVALVAFVTLTSALAASASIMVVQVTHNDVGDAETSIAINPTNPQNVVASWITGRGLSDQTCAFGVSFNGGRTWTIGRVPRVTKADGGTFDVATDPSVVFDRFGNAYLTCLAFNNFPPGTGSAGTIFVSRSTDGGVTWSDPVVAMTGEDSPGQSIHEFVDHQFITANPVNGQIYVTQTQFTAFGKPAILFTRSTDGGQTWAEPVRINDFAGSATFQDSFSAVGTDPQTIYVTFGAFSNTGLPNWNRIFIAKSGDGGVTFSRPQLLAVITPLPSPLPNALWRSDNNLWVAVDRATNQIFVNYADYNAGDADIRVMLVRDLGDHFEVQGITRVNDDGPGSDQFFPFITVAKGGRVDVCFQDRRYAPGNSLIFTTCAFSMDGAGSFRNVQVTTEGFDPGGSRFIGDYNWQASTDRLVMPIFVGSGGAGQGVDAEEVFVARVPA